MNSLGLVLGRFQPLHYGHVHIIQTSLRENDETVICIGSAQKAEPLPIEERHRRIQKQLLMLNAKNYQITDLIDPVPLSEWPSVVKTTCNITNHTRNTLYRADNDLTQEQLSELARLGMTVKIIPRIAFPYKDPTGIYHTVNSATDIKKIHKELGLEHLL